MTDDALRAAIGRTEPTLQLRALAVAGGMKTLIQDWIEGAISSVTGIRQGVTAAAR